MTVAAFILGWSLLGQARAADSPSTTAPRFDSRRTPTTKLEDTRKSNAPSSSRTRPNFSEEEEPAETAPRYRREKTAEPDTGRLRMLDPRESADNEPLTPVARMNQQMRPPEIIAEALADVREGALLGDPLRLTDAIKNGRDRAQQIKIAQVYWRLAVAEADYHFARDAVARFAEATDNQLNKSPALRAGRCALRALQRDAEALVIRAQNDLLTQMGSPAGAQVSLAVDKPHVGGYRAPEQLYSGRTMPARGYLITRLIPVRVAAIEEHGEGIVASIDAVDATTDEYRKEQADLTTLLIAFERLWKERKAFTGAVGEYNQDLAEFVLGAAPLEEAPSALVARLIKTDTTTRPATPSAPTRSSPRLSEPVDDEAPANPRTDDRYNRGRTFRSTEPEEPEPELKPLRSRSETSADPFGNRQTSYRRDPEFEEEASERALWRGLVDVDSPLRTQRLTAALNSEESLPRDNVQAATLGDCLTRGVSGARRAIVVSFWRAREAAAIHQVMTDESNELAALSQAGVKIRASVRGPETVIRLQALRKSVAAAITDAQISLLIDQFELTRLCNGDLSGDWLLPTTPPHGGRYATRLEDQPAELVQQRSLDQLATLVTLLHQQMEDHAGTVVYADSARAMALRDPGAGPEALDTAMALVERQATHTVFFLRATTRYNMAIADYVLAIMPNDASTEKLVSALVLTRSRTSRS